LEAIEVARDIAQQVDPSAPLATQAKLSTEPA
jgi:hypothetical protein